MVISRPAFIASAVGAVTTIFAVSLIASGVSGLAYAAPFAAVVVLLGALVVRRLEAVSARATPPPLADVSGVRLFQRVWVALVILMAIGSGGASALGARTSGIVGLVGSAVAALAGAVALKAMRRSI